LFHTLRDNGGSSPTTRREQGVSGIAEDESVGIPRGSIRQWRAQAYYHFRLASDGEGFNADRMKVLLFWAVAPDGRFFAKIGIMQEDPRLG
jgi:hypothetical protein